MRYSDTHEWIRPAADGRHALGISRFASDEIGEVAHVALPQIGDRLQAGTVCCEIESVKSVNEILTPVDGVVERVHTALLDDPTLINREPEEGAWLVELAGVDPAQVAALHDAATYRRLLEHQQES